MTRTNKAETRVVVILADEQEKTTIQRAAAREGRTLSNFLRFYGLVRAEERDEEEEK